MPHGKNANLILMLELWVLASLWEVWNQNLQHESMSTTLCRMTEPMKKKRRELGNWYKTALQINDIITQHRVDLWQHQSRNLIDQQWQTFVWSEIGEKKKIHSEYHAMNKLNCYGISKLKVKITINHVSEWNKN